MAEDPQVLRDAAAAIGSASQVALACHVNPDGDALGSMLGLLHVLRAQGRDVVGSFPSPFVVAPHYRHFPGLDLLVAPFDFPTAPEVMVTFDCGSRARLGDLEPAAKAARELVVIDHHISNEAYGTINVIHPNAAASAWVVQELIDEMTVPLVQDAAVCLYGALVCDTGRFQYDSTTPEVFELASRLTRFDVPIALMTRALFEEHRFAYLQLLAEALQTAQLLTERRFVSTVVTQDMLQRHCVTFEEIEGLIDVLRRTVEADVTCVLKQESDGAFRVSLRSLGTVDVCRIAASHGGGGHRLAAGFTWDDDAPSCVAAIVAAL